MGHYQIPSFLMAKKKVVIEEGADAAPVEEAVEEKVSGSSVTVTWPGGSRVYSKELHGADFRDLAKEFADKKGGKVK